MEVFLVILGIVIVFSFFTYIINKKKKITTTTTTTRKFNTTTTTVTTSNQVSFDIISKCNSSGGIYINNFVGAFEYESSYKAYDNFNDALNGDFSDVVKEKYYMSLIDGTYYIGLRDKNNTSKVIVKSCTVKCQVNFNVLFDCYNGKGQVTMLSFIGGSRVYEASSLLYNSEIEALNGNFVECYDRVFEDIENGTWWVCVRDINDLDNYKTKSIDVTCSSTDFIVTWNFTGPETGSHQFVVYHNSVLVVDVANTSSGTFKAELNDDIDTYMYVDCSDLNVNTGTIYYNTSTDTSTCPDTTTQLLNNLVSGDDFISGNIYLL